MITGKDPISLQVLEAFTQQQKLVDIAVAFNLSLDQVKRLKRLYNYTNTVLALTNEQTTEQFKQLGTKGLFLSPYIKANNALALTDILPFTNDLTTRDELLELMQQYDKKQERIQAFEQSYQAFLIASAEKETAFQQKIKELKQAKQKLLAKFEFIQQYEPAIQELLLYYVGIHRDGYYGLRRRVDSGFRKVLEKKNIIQLNDEYVWVIHSIDDFAKQLAYRLKYRHYIQWDYEREKHRMRNNEIGAMYVASEEDYKAIRNFTEETNQLEKEMQQLETELTTLADEKAKLQAELEANKRASILSFEEASIASDLMSERELLRHKEMQSLAMKWLYNQGFIVASEVVLPNKKRADVIGYNEEKIILLEVKSSKEDYRQDHKWTEYLPYCDEFYFFLDFYAADQADKQAGYIQEQGRTLTITQADTLPHHCEHRAETEWAIGRALSKKVTFGWS
ncbi:MmcB family DNA repair protein (plasmid) [Lysinibacillus capsici]|uniref:MmcB family DNA repair protein n=1 Tax=Lysinibacillus capsici TaxID=2115968 RepID=UPI0021D99381|nr:MmcB family DNA repair protein [Lysinibacillus capsici]UYB49939.1 MmcB family DNA repair protein [Lysinibacillus capsici]